MAQSGVKHAYMLVKIGGTEVGVIPTPEGITVNFETNDGEILSQRGGNIAELIISGGRVIDVLIAELETTPDEIERCFPDMDRDGDVMQYDADNVYTNYTASAALITLHPIALGATTDLDIVFWGVPVASDFQVPTAPQQAWMCQLHIRSVFRTAAAGQMIEIGASADTTPPTVTSVPADAAVDEAITVTPVLTFSEKMQVNLMTTANLKIILVDSGDDPPAEVTLTISYNNSTNKATLTPDSSLTLNKDYMIYVSDNLKDLAGNNLASVNLFGFDTVDA